jgi:hypothetical protein
MTNQICSCGCTKSHEIARRKSFDDYTIKIWSDGVLTYWFGEVLKGSGRPNAVKAQAVRLLMDDFGVLTTDEIPMVVNRAIKLLKKGVPEADVRAQVLDSSIIIMG